MTNFDILNQFSKSADHEKSLASIEFLLAEFGPEKASLDLILARARLLSKMGRWHAAVDAWAAILRLKPGDHESLLKMSKALCALGRNEEAIEPLLAAHGKRGTRESAALLLARAYQALNQPAQAAQFWKQLALKGERLHEALREWIRAASAAGELNEMLDAVEIAGNHKIFLRGQEENILRTVLTRNDETTADRLLQLNLVQLLPSIANHVYVIYYTLTDQIDRAAVHFNQLTSNAPSQLSQQVAEWYFPKALKHPERHWYILSTALEWTREGRLAHSLTARLLCESWVELVEIADNPDEMRRVWVALVVGRFLRLGRHASGVFEQLILRNFSDVALNLFEATPQQHSVFASLKKVLWKVKRALGDYLEAVELIQSSSLQEPEKHRAVTDCLIAAGCSEHAERYVLTANATSPAAPADVGRAFNQHLDLCRVYTSNADWTKLEREAQSCLIISPLRLEGYTYLATSYINRLCVDMALKVYMAALAYHERSPLLLTHMGLAFRAKGSLSEALSCYKRAFTLDHTSPLLISLIGDLIRTPGYEDELTYFLDSVASIPPNSPGVDVTITSILYEGGQIDAIMSRMPELELKSSSDPRLAIVLARALQAAGNSLGAKKVLESHYRSRASFTEVGREYFTSVVFSGKMSEARRVLRERPQLLKNAGTLDALSSRLMEVYFHENAYVDAWRTVGQTNFFRAFDRFRRTIMDSHSFQSIRALPRSDPFLEQHEPDTVGQAALPSFIGASSSPRRSLIFSVQGIGDEIRFASIYRDLKFEHMELTITCSPRLHSMLQRSFPNQHFLPTLRRDQGLISSEFLGPHMGLPDSELGRMMDFRTFEVARTYDEIRSIHEILMLLRPNRASFGGGDSYLVSDPERDRQAELIVAGLDRKPRVGICWSSGNTRSFRSMHYTNLDQWSPIFQIDANFINLKYGDCEEVLDRAEELFKKPIIRVPDVDLKNDFESLGGLIKCMDAVICPGVALAEFSSALGIPTICMWRVPSALWRRTSVGRDVWHNSEIPVFGQPIWSSVSVLEAAAEALEEIVSNWSPPP